MSNPANRAAWLSSEKQKPLEIKDAPFPTAGKDELVVQLHAIAINPVDWKLQKHAMFPLSYPNIIGVDIAGTVHSSNHASFKEGDRVIAHSAHLASGKPEEGAFQQYARVRGVLTTRIPDNVELKDAVVLPLAVSTAASGLFQQSHLALPMPKLEPKKTGKTVLVWGGSSSVGTAAIQLASAAGVEVVSTASERNHDIVEKLGAEKVFDHTASDVVEQLVTYLSGKEVVGVYDAISSGGTIEKSAEVLSKLRSADGGKNKDQVRGFVVTTLPAPEKGIPEGVETKNVFAVSIADNEVGPAVWGEYLPQALANGVLEPAPKAQVIGTGLESIQEAMNANERGLSAAKAVVVL